MFVTESALTVADTRSIIGARAGEGSAMVISSSSSVLYVSEHPLASNFEPSMPHTPRAVHPRALPFANGLDVTLGRVISLCDQAVRREYCESSHRYGPHGERRGTGKVKPPSFPARGSRLGDPSLTQTKRGHACLRQLPSQSEHLMGRDYLELEEAVCAPSARNRCLPIHYDNCLCHLMSQVLFDHDSSLD